VSAMIGVGGKPLLISHWRIASALEDDVRRSLDAGCDRHVSKPVKKAVLLDAIREATAARASAGSEPEQTAAGTEQRAGAAKLVA